MACVVAVGGCSVKLYKCIAQSVKIAKRGPSKARKERKGSFGGAARDLIGCLIQVQSSVENKGRCCGLFDSKDIT
jgi:hypothetical protein